MEKMTLVKACQQHLTLPGEKLSLADYKKLTPEDKTDLIAAFAVIGIDTSPESQPSTSAA